MIKIKEMPINEIKMYEKNARKNDKAIELVKQSIKDYGFRVPIVVDKNNVIIAGHTRFKAAIQLEVERIPVIVADDLTEEQVKALRLADNKTAELATWDLDKLEAELDSIDDEKFAELFRQNKYEDFEQYNGEIDLNDFDDEVFDYECPECGFRFNA